MNHGHPAGAAVVGHVTKACCPHAFVKVKAAKEVKDGLALVTQSSLTGCKLQNRLLKGHVYRAGPLCQRRRSYKSKNGAID